MRRFAAAVPGTTDSGGAIDPDMAGSSVEIRHSGDASSARFFVVAAEPSPRCRNRLRLSHNRDDGQQARCAATDLSGDGLAGRYNAFVEVADLDIVVEADLRDSRASRTLKED